MVNSLTAFGVTGFHPTFLRTIVLVDELPLGNAPTLPGRDGLSIRQWFEPRNL